MQIKTSFSVFHKCTLALMLGMFLFSSCGSEGQPVEQTPTETVDSIQIAEPAETADNQNAVLINFDFEHFGSYDLSTWTTKAPQTGGGGDVETEVLTYEKDGLKMDIEEVYMGEHGYAVWYRLTGADGKVQKVRSLEFTNEPYAVTESVNDYTVEPAKKYSRTQETGKHYSQISPLLPAVTGA